MIDIYLPWPPSVNNYWARTRFGMKLKKQAKDYRKAVIDETQRTQCDLGLECRIAIKIVLYPPDRRKRDIDNVLKGLLDSLEHANVFVNDSQIDDLHIVRSVQRDGGGVLVIIENMDEQVED